MFCVNRIKIYIYYKKYINVNRKMIKIKFLFLIILIKKVFDIFYNIFIIER